MRITFWGTRGSIAVPGKDTTKYGGNTTCLEITLESGTKVVIDAGTGIRALGEKLVAEEERVSIYLLITHIHWDHVLGFPFFAPIYSSTARIIIDGYPSCMKGLRYTFDNKMGDGFFPIRFDDLTARLQYLEQVQRGPLTIEDTVIEGIPLQHPQGGFGYRFKEGDKTLVFLTDNELRKGRRSGGIPKEYTAFCRDADILIHDAQYTPREIDERKGWGHSDYEAAIELACRAGARKLILFHHDPSRTDSQMDAVVDICSELASQRNPALVVEAARENDECIL
ncbi:MAG: MBL fold metallo-hydrolase [Deltaproteobacteria bacterium]|nr:MBL fold metallo-hydrolase [Deltaproteobacteria bacterium]MBW2017179.1 MBL fold metallo-hydrolase [Deltaproteobacteria bacterium]MBW2128588.1 MBL fold metallo-hydrolase [Deltaproteobacteria bacterium]MBW2303155.1 MBL fold metallo-hydrolase [Deltaproteobacteria bacterium]